MRFTALASLLAMLALPAPAAAMKHLVVLLDDCGYDGFSCFGVPDAPSTPTIDALSDVGVTFRNAWANPTCAPSRASLVTGQYARDHGLSWNTGPPLDPSGPSLAKAASQAGLITWHVGKWHMGNADTLPQALGFDYSVGPAGNIGAGESYYDFDVLRNGVPETVTTYATTWEVDEAIARIAAAGEQDWLGYLAFSAPHAPYHDPPCELHSYGCDPLPDDFTRYRAAIEAADTELARLLAVLPPDTMVYLACDNGTPEAVVSPSAPYRGAKGDATEGGIRVPLIVAGPGVAASAEGGNSFAMSHLIDLFATIAAIEGLPGQVPPLSADLSQHLANPASGPVRLWMAAEQFGGPGVNRFSRAVGYQNRWKLVWEHETDPPQFYDLWTDPMELLDLAPGGDTTGLSETQFGAYKTLLSLLDDTPECADLVDNDFDGKIDLLDPQCVALWDRQERVANSCGLGFEVIVVLAFWARRRRPARRA